jgi:MFS family permease
MMRRLSEARFFISACLITGVFIFLSGTTDNATLLFTYRVLAGIASAWIFVSGGVLAAQLGQLHSQQSGLILGIFYGGPGLGILLSSLLVPGVQSYGEAQQWSHIWQGSWYALGFLCFVLTFFVTRPVSTISTVPAKSNNQAHTSLMSYLFMLMAYFMFGVGYIGYMTFVVALLKQLGIDDVTLHIFYGLLGLAVMFSSRIWAGLLDRYRGGQSLAILNTLLGCASLIPAVIAMQGLELNKVVLGFIFLSGIIFGAVFLSAVASTTAFVKHNLPANEWVAGITAFTSIFAIGQVLGPTVVGWISDGQGGLEFGLLLSSIALLVGGAIATLQKSLLPKN